MRRRGRDRAPRAVAKLLEPGRELAALVALRGVRVPAAGSRQTPLEPDVGANELRDLAQALAEAPARVHGAVGGLNTLRIGGLSIFTASNGLAAGAVEQIAHPLFVAATRSPCSR
jgi:hypothetical protein